MKLLTCFCKILGQFELSILSWQVIQLGSFTFQLASPWNLPRILLNQIDLSKVTPDSKACNTSQRFCGPIFDSHLAHQQTIWKIA